MSMTAKFNADILGQLSDASLDAINEALAAIRADAAALRAETEGKPATEASVTAYQGLLDAARQLNAEKASRAALADTQAAQFNELDDLTASAPDPAPEPDAPAVPDPAPAPEDAPDPADPATVDPAGQPTPEGNAPTGEPNGDTGPTDTGDSAVTASARRPLGGINGPTDDAAPDLPKVTMRTTAAGGLPNIEPGAQLNREQLITAFSTKGQAVSGRNISGYERYTVATVRTEYPEDRMLRRGVSAHTNMNRVDAASRAARRLHARDNQAQLTVRRGPQADDVLTAAGLCAPLETDYDIEVIGDVDRPVRDSLVRMGAERGGLQWRPALDGVTQTGGIGVWTAEDDEATPLVPKVCVEIDCPGILTAEVDAVYQCLTFSNMSTRFDPEWMDATIEAQNIAHARFAENRLLTQITTASKGVFSSQLLGAVRDTLPTLDRMVAYYRNVHRLNGNAPLRWIAPAWFRDMMRADIAMQMVGDGLVSLAVADEELARWLAVRNVNVTWHIDGINPPDVGAVVTPNQFYTLLAANSPVPDFPTPVSTVLFREGDWTYLDGGTLDLGVVRDSALNVQNRFQTFSESFETTAFRGIESIHLVLEVIPTGQSAATEDTTPPAP
jgi:hypothetical protein